VKGELAAKGIGILSSIDTIQAEDVEVHVESEGGVHALHRCYRAGERFLDSRKSEQLLCAPL
jgi:hypothetical protein